MFFGIATFPQKHVQDIANSYRKRYDPRYALIPPHITLKERFPMQETHITRAADALEQIAQTTAPFTIQISKVSHFHPTSATLYLVIEDAGELTQLHQQISKPFEPKELPYDYIPHITIGQQMEGQELHDVYSMLRLKLFSLQSTIDRFHLMYQLENDSWTIYQTFLLRG
jgi:2'-5' RNA ligase